MAEVGPVRVRTAGIPWLGFVVYPTHRLVKARKVRATTRKLHERLAAFSAGEIEFEQFDASVQGWIDHVSYADTWGLRQHVLRKLSFPAAHRSPVNSKPAKQ